MLWHRPLWLLGFVGVTCACQPNAPTTQPTTLLERQEAALRDPFGYSPGVGNRSVSGKGEFDKEGIKKDFDHVFNP